MRPSRASPMGLAGARNILESLFRLALGLLPVGLAVWVNSSTGWLVFGCMMMVLAAVAVARDELAGRLQRGLAETLQAFAAVATTHNELARQIGLLRDEAAGQASETAERFARDLKAAVGREQAREPCGYKRDWKADHPARWMNPGA